MIVLDASAAVEILLRTQAGVKIEVRTLGAGEDIHAPHVIDLQVAQALRRLAAGGTQAQACSDALEDWMLFPVERIPHDALLPRIWELRGNFTAYDGASIALAELISAPLIARDRKLKVGHKAKIEVI